MIKDINRDYRGHLKIIEGVRVMQTPKITHILNRRDGRPAFVEFIIKGKSKLLSIKHFQERYQSLIPDVYTPADNEKSPEVA